MSALNNIEPEHVKLLKKHELLKLLRILLYSEAKNRRASVHVPLQIDVPDGGEDGRWSGDVEPNDYIPNRFTIYQCKAQDVSIGDCRTELLKDPLRSGRASRRQGEATTKSPSRLLKEQVAEVLNSGGAFVFFCGHPYVEKDIKRRIESAGLALKEAGRPLWNTDQIVFLDANKIAAWTNGHSSAIAHVYECCKLARPVNFRTWANWQRDGVVNATRFHSNAKLDEHMASLRTHLIQPRSVARITGLSGLGKTRLAFEALRPPKDTSNLEHALMSETAVYADFEEDREAIFAVVRQLASAGCSGTLVVDNCPRNPPHHDKLADIVRMDGSNLSLLTLDYEPERVTSGFLHIALEREVMFDVIPAMLKDLPQARLLTEHQITRIAEFASGFPQIAALMAEAQDALDWEQLNQKGLADKIIWGRDGRNEKAWQIIRSLALFTHVGFEGRVENQKEFVRMRLCPGISDREFREFCGPFRRKRILQNAGDYVMVTPPPLAVALAADWWGNATEQELIGMFPEMEKCGLRPYFCNQVERLHFSQNAQIIAAKLCGGDGPLADAEVLNTVAGSQLFRAMVELNPRAALDCVYRVFATKPSEDLLKIEEGRRELVWSLEKLCWERANFPRAAELLLNFAAAENEKWGNNATGQFKQLFHLVLSGTQTPALERLEVIENGLRSSQSGKRRICIEALGSALKSQLFSRSGGVEVRGSGLPQADWYPNGFREMADYWVKAVNLLRGVILERSSESALAKEVLGDNLRGILMPALLIELEPAIRQIAEAENHFWLEGLSSLRMVLAYDKDRHSAQSLAKLQEWTEWFSPQDLERRLNLVVTHAPYEDRQNPDGDHVDVAEENAVKLAEEIADGKREWIHLLPKLLQGEQRQAWAFGRRLGELDANPEAFVSTCVTALREIDSKERNIGLLTGFLAGLEDRELATRTLEAIANDEELRTLLPQLTAHSKPQKADVERVARLILAGQIDANQLRICRYWGVMHSLPLTPQEVIAILEPIARQRLEARAPVYDVLSMYTFQSEDRWRGCRSFIKQLLCSEGFLKGLNLSQDAYHWQGHALKILGEEDDPEFAINQTRQILEIQTDNDLWLAADRDAKKVLGAILRKYPAVCWPFVGEAILSDECYMLSTLFKSHEFVNEPSSVLWEAPTSIVADWAAKHPFAVWRILEISALFTTNKDRSYAWHPTILKLLEQPFDDHWGSAIGANLYSFGSFGSRVPYFEGRISLLKQLGDHHNAKVRAMAKSLIARFEKDKEHQEKWDEEHSAGIASPPPL